MIDLNNAPCNKILEIKSLSDGTGWRHRLEAVGIRKGQRVRKIVCQPFGGPIVIEVGGSRISMGRGIASKIAVEVVHTAKVP
ncbi:MAG: FeoA domain protein [Methanosaeta sp. PtaB.Bin039]|nr:MAG: FeoA domain protein [Methanosaeta sp. PtaB.Bin039]OPY47838.1 MAG: FeoA domain protein [Methanosaeta sp. PtaU1.Bin028]